MARSGKMRLGAFFNPTGHHVASWRHPEAQADAGINLAHYVEISRTAERGKFDMIFLADQQYVRPANIEAVSRSAQYVAQFEPLTLLSAIAALTQYIGLVATATTSYFEPYHIARKFASLDHLSAGRAGWNIVTGANAAEAYNFGRDNHYAHEERYDRAAEFTRVVMGLWDSWDDDAFLRDKRSGVFFHPEKLHALDHKGEHFKVKGPLNIPRPPQGHPVLVQAGSSPTGRTFAAEFAEVVFTNQPDKKQAQEFYRALKDQVSDFGREPDDVKVMPGISPIVGRTAEEADEKFDALESLTHPIVLREILSTQLGGFDLSSYPFDGPLPDLPPHDGINASASSYQKAIDMARNENLTIRQLAKRVAFARGKAFVRGTPEQIADQFEDWFQSEAADGFNIAPPYLPGSLNDFVDLVVPVLQKRGLFRTEYEGRTLRDHLGLKRPSSRYCGKTGGCKRQP
jgi:FMN-dependent oxidoreductase (nitrilotriacetate monooxygenase family)